MGSIRGVILRHRLLAAGVAVVLAMLLGSSLGTLFWFRMTSGGGSDLAPAVSAGAGQGKITVDEGPEGAQETLGAARRELLTCEAAMRERLRA